MLAKILPWLYVLVGLGAALLGNYVGATWASKDEKFSLWLLALFIVSPFVFITFGLVTSRFGVSVGSGTLDALLTVSTIIMGLIVFHEWSKVSTGQYFALMLIVGGIILLHLTALPDR